MALNRHFVAIAASCIVASLALSSAWAAPRVVFFEEATNYGCPPCAQSDPIISQVIDSFGDQVAAVKWHVWWPVSNDPFNNYNPDPITTRINYYSINAAPTVVIGGTNRPSPFDEAAMTAVINTLLAIPSPVAINCSGDVDAPGGQCNIFVDVDVETPVVGGDYRLFVALVEEEIYLLGPNGYPYHEDVFRWINNGNQATGEPIDLSTTGLQQFSYTMPFDPSFQEGEMGVRAWIQEYSTREALQAGKAHLLVPYLVSMNIVGTPNQIGGASEPVNFEGELLNEGSQNDVYDLSVSGVPAGWTYSYTTPAGTFSGPSTIGLDAGAAAPIQLTLDSAGNSGTATVTVQAQSQNDPTKVASIEFQKINDAQVLLVDGDDGGTRDLFVGDALNNAGVLWGKWDLDWGSLTTSDLETAANSVFWIEGNTRPTLTADDRAAISGFMDNGGKILISGQDIAADLWTEPETILFVVNYLHCTFTNDGPNAYFVDGVAGDPIGDGLSGVGLSPSGATEQTTHDAIAAGFDANLVFQYDVSSFGAAVRWTDGTTHVVFMAFGLEGIIEPSTRNEVTERVLSWFGIEASGIADPAPVSPRIALSQNAPNPFRPSTTITYRLPEAGQVDLRVFDIQGRAIRNLVSEPQTAATYRIEWDGKDDAGHQVASGVYFYRLVTPSATETRRMVLTR